MKTDKQTIQYVIDALERESSNYSQDHTPERIVRIRTYIKKLKNQLGS
jgi:hypothetical protein